MSSQVVVAAFRESFEAQLALRALGERGIIGTAEPRSDAHERLCAEAFDGGVDVLVDRAVAEEAIALVERLWPAPVEFADVERCGECGSTDIAALHRLRLFLLAVVVLLTGGFLVGQRDLFALVAAIVGVILLLAPNRRCRSCGERWTAPWRVAPENAREGTEVPCPACRSSQTESITRRREKALTLLVNVIMPPFFLVWPRLPRHRCAACGHEWR